MESGITKCFSNHKTSAVNANFWCQSLEIKDQGLLFTLYSLALTNNDSGRNVLWKRMSSFPVLTVASLDQNSVQQEDRLRFEGEGWQEFFFPQKEKTLDILSHFSSYFRKLTLECNGTRPHESSEVAEMHSGRCRKTLNEVNTACWGRVATQKTSHQSHCFSLDPLQVTNLPCCSNLQATTGPLNPSRDMHYGRADRRTDPD